MELYTLIKKSMKLKISTPAKAMYQGEIQKIAIPTENGKLYVSAGHAPMVTSIKPGIITIWPLENNFKPGSQIHISTSKWMVFVDGKFVRIVSAEATSTPESTEEHLYQSKKLLEEKIRRLKSEGSIEEIEKAIIKLEKIDADIELKKLLQTA